MSQRWQYYDIVNPKNPFQSFLCDCYSVYVWHHSHISMVQTRIHEYTNTQNKRRLFMSESVSVRVCVCVHLCSVRFNHCIEKYLLLLFAHLNFGFDLVVIAAKYIWNSLRSRLSLSLLAVYLKLFILLFFCSRNTDLIFHFATSDTAWLFYRFIFIVLQYFVN